MRSINLSQPSVQFGLMSNFILALFVPFDQLLLIDGRFGICNEFGDEGFCFGSRRSIQPNDRHQNDERKPQHRQRPAFHRINILPYNRRARVPLFVKAVQDLICTEKLLGSRNHEDNKSGADQVVEACHYAFSAGGTVRSVPTATGVSIRQLGKLARRNGCAAFTSTKESIYESGWF
jgi:hypothetical protein